MSASCYDVQSKPFTYSPKEEYKGKKVENKFLLHSFDVFLTLVPGLSHQCTPGFFWLFCTTLFLEKGNVSCQSQLCYGDRG